MAQGPADINAPVAATQWRDLRARTLSALVAGPVALAALWYGGVAWQALIALMAFGMALEWRGLCVALGYSPLRSIGLGVLYLAPACVALVWLRTDPLVGRGNVLFLVLTVWASDIGAYLAGRMIGGPKLAPSISPGKTRSGSLGGLASVVLVGLIAVLFVSGGSLVHAAVVAVVLGVASQSGDLLESAIKRWAGVKDSGRLMPGHGGLLDRLDGMLFAAPVAALLAWAAGEGFWLWVGMSAR